MKGQGQGQCTETRREKILKKYKKQRGAVKGKGTHVYVEVYVYQLPYPSVSRMHAYIICHPPLSDFLPSRFADSSSKAVRGYSQ